MAWWVTWQFEVRHIRLHVRNEVWIKKNWKTLTHQNKKKSTTQSWRASRYVYSHWFIHMCTDTFHQSWIIERTTPKPQHVPAILIFLQQQRAVSSILWKIDLPYLKGKNLFLFQRQWRLDSQRFDRFLHRSMNVFFLLQSLAARSQHIGRSQRAYLSCVTFAEDDLLLFEVFNFLWVVWLLPTLVSRHEKVYSFASALSFVSKMASSSKRSCMMEWFLKPYKQFILFGERRLCSLL